MSRPSGLDQEGVRDQLAELLSLGASRAECAETFAVSKDTIRAWAKDAKVVEKMRTLRQSRVDEIVQKVDGAIHGKLAKAGDLTVRDLLAIRAEYSGESNATGKKDNTSAAEELWEKIGDDPAFGEALKEATGQ